MLSLGELLSNRFFPLFRSNLTAKFDKKQAIFQEINRNLDSPESSWTFPGLRLNISRKLLEPPHESSGTFLGIFNNIPQDLLQHSRNPLKHSPKSFWTFPGIFPSILRNAKMRTFPGILSKTPRNHSEHSSRSMHSRHSVLYSCVPGFINSRVIYDVNFTL